MLSSREYPESSVTSTFRVVLPLHTLTRACCFNDDGIDVGA